MQLLKKYKKLIFFVLFFVYIASFVYVFSNFVNASNSDVCSNGWQYLVIFSIMSIIVRGLRYCVLLRFTNTKVPLFKCILFYYSGLGFTFTPGKVGELTRYYYLKDYNQSFSYFVYAFIHERVIDVIALLSIVALCLGWSLYLVIGLSVVFWIIFYYAELSEFIENSNKTLLKRFATFNLEFKKFVNVKLCFVSMLLSISAWSAQAYGVALYIGDYVSNNVPFGTSFSLYPVSLCFGAISCSPSGIGTTEFCLYTILKDFIDTETAVVIAFVMRLWMFWCNIIIGFMIFMSLYAFTKFCSHKLTTFK